MPEVPNKCLLFSGKAVHRDFFISNPQNKSHYQYPKFETYSYDIGCHSKQVKKIINLKDKEKYTIFYTNYLTIGGGCTNIVTGLFSVDKYDAFLGSSFSTDKPIMLLKTDCIPIDYKARGVPASYGNSKIKHHINHAIEILLNKLNSKSNISDIYNYESNKIVNLAKTRDGIDEIINTCTRCISKQICFFGRKNDLAKRQKLINIYLNVK